MNLQGFDAEVSAGTATGPTVVGAANRTRTISGKMAT